MGGFPFDCAAANTLALLLVGTGVADGVTEAELDAMDVERRGEAGGRGIDGVARVVEDIAVAPCICNWNLVYPNYRYRSQVVFICWYVIVLPRISVVDYTCLL